jgi:hypothetical protein
MDHADAQVLSGARGWDVDLFALIEDPPGIFTVDAGEHFHEGRLACAVLPDKGVNFAAAQLELALAEGMDAGKAFFDAFHGH